MPSPISTLPKTDELTITTNTTSDAPNVLRDVRTRSVSQRMLELLQIFALDLALLHALGLSDEVADVLVGGRIPRYAQLVGDLACCERLQGKGGESCKGPANVGLGRERNSLGRWAEAGEYVVVDVEPD